MYKDERFDVVEAPVKLEPWQEQLLRAAQYIREHGWTRGRTKNSQTGQVCLAGAVIYSATTSDLGGENWKNIAPRLEAILGKHPVNWNDVDAKSGEEVISFLERAAGSK